MEKRKGGAAGAGVVVPATLEIDSRSQSLGANCSSSGPTNAGPNTSDRLLGRCDLLSNFLSFLFRSSSRHALRLAAADNFFGISGGRSKSFQFSYGKYWTKLLVGSRLASLEGNGMGKGASLVIITGVGMGRGTNAMLGGMGKGAGLVMLTGVGMGRGTDAMLGGMGKGASLVMLTGVGMGRGTGTMLGGMGKGASLVMLTGVGMGRGTDAMLGGMGKGASLIMLTDVGMGRGTNAVMLIGLGWKRQPRDSTSLSISRTFFFIFASPVVNIFLRER